MAALLMTLHLDCGLRICREPSEVHQSGEATMSMVTSALPEGVKVALAPLLLGGPHALKRNSLGNHLRNPLHGPCAQHQPDS